MKKILLILCAIALISTASQCKKDVTPTPSPTPIVAGSLEMTFKALYANRPLIINNIYDYNGKKIRFEKLQFFIAYDGPSLETAVGDNTPKTALIKLTNLTDSVSAVEGVTVDIPLASRNWSSINLGTGIPKTLNAKLPKDFSFPDGMSDSGNYWDSWQSYIFAKLEGKIDKDGDGLFETGITLHTGGNEVFTPLKYTKIFLIKDATTTKVTFELNLNELVKNIDLTTVNSTHQVGSSAVMKVMMGNFPTALTIK